ncbi:MAG: phosphate ABC transporter permease PstA [Actinomycetota bacterium]|nr:phosphate ABC transporter permease PstA [Actinomycetota bacterium]
MTTTTTTGHDAPETPAAAPATTVPRVVATPVPPQHLRTLGGVTRADVLEVGGAALSSVATGFLLFGRLTPLAGPFGQVVVTFVLFVVAYGFLVSLREDRPGVVNKVMTVLLGAAAFVAFAALATVIVFTLLKGRQALLRSNFYLDDMSEAGPLDPLSRGGIRHAIVGTLVIISLAGLFTVPLGIVCAVFINETRSRLAGTVRTVVDAMTALPSIVAGLFIFALFILILGFPRSGLAAAIAVSVMMLPIIIRSADVVLRIVPGNLREASAALGAPQWRTVWHVVLPTAKSGLATAVILGIARGVGETAPVLLVSGSTAAFNANPNENPMMSLPLMTYEFVRAPQRELQIRGFATAAVLMVLVLVLFVVARIVGGRGAGQLTRRQARRRVARSARDLVRIEARPQEVPA